MKKIILLLILLTSSFSFAFNIPRFVGINDEYFEFDGLTAFFDGEEITNNKINGIDYEDGAHVLRLVGQFEEFIFKVIVDTVPPTNTNYILKDPNLVIFEKPVTEVNLNSRTDFFKPLNTKNTTRPDYNPIVVCSKDEAGNLGGFEYIKPSVSNITPLDSKVPLGGISNKIILLSSNSPYKAIGRIIIPTQSTLFFEPNVELKTVGPVQFTIKGNIYIPENVKISGKLDIDLQQNGTIYINSSNINGNISSNGGKLLFLDNLKQENISLSKTNVAIVKNSIIENFSVKFIPLLVIENSTITNLNIVSSRTVIINNSLVNNLHVEGFTNVRAYNLTSFSFKIENFTNIKLIDSNILDAKLDKGVYLHSKNTLFESLNLSNYSVATLNKITIHKLSLFKSKISKKFTVYLEIQKDNSSIIEEY
ncbi:hypothetical protein [Thermosipho atlanticus]|uniref:Uncharacterized protein n=1 Tax=Thermosipho atlanticus DSM 15807 TaxID=1123380 RepID=A0A1M5T638_9BACT|nr:hypothetical protein [Thermosipho atlanticus]SHH46166.1 hypothetical protein SAMN02745199_1189 [Thermosipho atlanticus DSM 15807]